MANYEFKTVTNQFKTTNNNEVKKVFEKLGFEVELIESKDELVVYSDEMTFDDGLVVVRDEDGKVIGAFNENDISLAEYLMEINEEDTIHTYGMGCETQALDSYIQEMLVDDGMNFFKMVEVGSEKFRYVCGWVMVITPFHIQAYNLDQLADSFAVKSLESKGNTHFKEEKGEV